ncbi:DUF4184 family protein [Hymenobacter jejuensis]|uniref:DUF4184 family protein n=1 Tax=Hymenobacter jejuensis TaxID=2502781 RepID=A0A5B8A2L8_9BACT|nr:DUF4184 family protein [Hymenobacter jejuensis]QDA60936.1 DUF4184 family protein [Hymenobacter jejuensis]
MPFTLAHPALVLPLIRPLRRWLSATGLVVGSMAPDFEYFFRLRSNRGHAHNLLALVWFDLPLSLLVIALVHGVVRKPLVRCLPTVLHDRLGWMAEKPWPLTNLWSARVLLAIAIGSLSHLLWDGFTHIGYIADLLPFLKKIVAGRQLLGWLQLISSVLGLLVVGWAIWRLPKVTGPKRLDHIHRQAFWRVNFFLMLVIWVVFLLINQIEGHRLIVPIIVSGISASAAALVLSSAVLRNPWRSAHSSTKSSDSLRDPGRKSRLR